MRYTAYICLLLATLFTVLLGCNKQEPRQYQVVINSSKFDLIEEKAHNVSDTSTIMALNDSVAYEQGIEAFINKYCQYATLSKDIPYYNYNVNVRPINFIVLDSIKTDIKTKLKSETLLSLESRVILTQDTQWNFSFVSAINYQKNRDEHDEVLLKKDRAETRHESEAFNKTKAGRIKVKHPDWSREDCERLAKNRIWVGMGYDMLKYLRGLPNSANPSNYGSGTNWQWCWHDYTPSCFYDTNGDGKIDSYN